MGLAARWVSRGATVVHGGVGTVAADGTGGVDSAAGTMHVPSDESTSGDSEATRGADDESTTGGESTTGDEPSTEGPHEETTTGPIRCVVEYH